MGRPPITPLPGNGYGNDCGDGEDDRLRYCPQQHVPPEQGHDRRRVLVNTKGDGVLVPPQPSGRTAVALVLSMVLVLAVQVGVWVLVIGSEGSGQDGVGYVFFFFFFFYFFFVFAWFLAFDRALTFQAPVMVGWESHDWHPSCRPHDAVRHVSYTPLELRTSPTWPPPQSP
ncbi:hypothetical protein B0I37DRAFT_362138 [Chaetomium sp. MPI-CAGE-AT-0009]|nr:hypothetical protein B0I37DRAFT_362138 [Chaetomium sp. MPI-CAGE-AT-0009]